MSAARVVPGEDPGLGRAFAIGSLVGFVVTLLLVGGMTLALGVGLAPAFGIGLFTACWGGPGFGGMMGAVLHHARNEHP